MCGIAGIVRLSDKPIAEEQIAALLIGNEHRGNDATGIAFQQDNGTIHVLKNDMAAWRFVTFKAYLDFIAEYLTPETWAVILHTRGATVGSPRVNENNHPMFAGKTAVVHNGCIRNDSQLFIDHKIERKAETDSDILRGILDRYGFNANGIEQLGHVRGSVACAALSPDSPHKLILARSGSPMTLASSQDTFYFSSEKKTLHKALRTMHERWGMWFQVQKPEIAFAPMPDDTAWIIGERGKESHHAFRTLFELYREPLRETYTRNASRQSKWDSQTNCRVLAPVDSGNKDNAWCTKCKRTWTIPAGRNPVDFTCNTEQRGCGQSLVSMKERGK